MEGFGRGWQDLDRTKEKQNWCITFIKITDMGEMNFPRRIVENVVEQPRRIAENVVEQAHSNPLSGIVMVVGLIATVALLVLFWIFQNFYTGFRWGFFALSITLVLNALINCIDGDDDFGTFIGTLICCGLINAVAFIWSGAAMFWVLVVLLILGFCSD